MSAEHAGGRPAGNPVEIKVPINRNNVKQIWRRGIPVEQVDQEIQTMHEVQENMHSEQRDVPFSKNGNHAILGDISTARRKSRRRIRNGLIRRRNK